MGLLDPWLIWGLIMLGVLLGMLVFCLCNVAGDQPRIDPTEIPPTAYGYDNTTIAGPERVSRIDQVRFYVDD